MRSIRTYSVEITHSTKTKIIHQKMTVKVKFCLTDYITICLAFRKAFKTVKAKQIITASLIQIN